MFFKEKLKNLQSKTPRECLLASPSLHLLQFLCKQLLTTAHDETISTVLISYQHKPEAAPFQKCLHQRSSLQMSSDKVRALAYLECNIMSQHKRWVLCSIALFQHSHTTRGLDHQYIKSQTTIVLLKPHIVLSDLTYYFELFRAPLQNGLSVSVWKDTTKKKRHCIFFNFTVIVIS